MTFLTYNLSEAKDLFIIVQLVVILYLPRDLNLQSG